MKKAFIISIDTEGDDLWQWKPGDVITTMNAYYLKRFQALCDRYGFMPTYLTNYEMALDDYFTDFAKDLLRQGRCEIGMHLHAWNTPPLCELSVRADGKWGAPYLIEYSEIVMEQKIEYMTSLLTKRFGVCPVTHRAGRWTMNQTYFEILTKFGYRYDCSVTPGISWVDSVGQTQGSAGSDYTREKRVPHLVTGTGIFEIPVTVKTDHRLRHNPGEGIRKGIRNRYRALRGQGKIWLRPNGHNLEDMLYLTDCVYKSMDGYLMFMLHSSELMPGGNPVFRTNDDINALYHDIELLFAYIADRYEGETIGGYGDRVTGHNGQKCIVKGKIK